MCVILKVILFVTEVFPLKTSRNGSIGSAETCRDPFFLLLEKIVSRSIT